MDVADNNSNPESDNNKDTPLSNSEADISVCDITEPSDSQCYCNNPRNYFEPELQCATCFKWFHHKCLKYNIGSFHPFVTSYHFTCSMCNSSEGLGEEKFAKKNASFHMMCQTALGNLMVQNGGKVYFSMERDILPYLEKHWDLLASMPRKTNNSWYETIQRILLKSELFKGREEGSDVIVCLANKDVGKIGPSYERFLALASQFNKNTSSSTTTQPKIKRRLQNQILIDADQLSRESKLTRRNNSGFATDDSLNGPECATGNLNPSNGNVIGDQNVPFNNNMSNINSNSNQILSTLSSGIVGTAATNCRLRLNSCGFPIDYPFNKDNYRYVLVEPDPHAPGRKIWEENDSTAGKPIPGFFYRIYLHPLVLLSCNDRAAQLKLNSSTQMSVTGEKGYCMVRSTHSVAYGRWYFEVKIIDQPDGSHARIGWSQSLANLHTPCGYDKFGYSWRSRKGTIFHESCGKHYADKGYGKGDVIGCFIDLTDPFENWNDFKNDNSFSMERILPRSLKDKALIKFKNHYYFEEKDDLQQGEKNLKTLKNSKIIFYRNGESQGVAFKDIYGGAYYPSISLYRSIHVEVNFGPNFDYPPDEINYNPMCQRIDELEVDQSLSDLLFLVDTKNTVKKMLSK